MINNIKWIKLPDQLADILTKQSPDPLPLINALNDGFTWVSVKFLMVGETNTMGD